MKTPPSTDREMTRASWLDDVLRLAGTRAGDGWEALHDALDALAVRTAPVARTTWKWVVAAQGLAVLAPMLWLMRTPFEWSASLVALLSLLAVGALVGILWWVRWRGMQRVWARARLLAEVARA
ncbi:MAG TPA: hypothetical protein PK490_18185, partial [Prosthecobacter sp.]|nr:hypothetical protein [Prosthecobacter sp.]